MLTVDIYVLLSNQSTRKVLFTCLANTNNCSSLFRNCFILATFRVLSHCQGQRNCNMGQYQDAYEKCIVTEKYKYLEVLLVCLDGQQFCKSVYVTLFKF